MELKNNFYVFEFYLFKEFYFLMQQNTYFLVILYLIKISIDFKFNINPFSFYYL